MKDLTLIFWGVDNVPEGNKIVKKIRATKLKVVRGFWDEGAYLIEMKSQDIEETLTAVKALGVPEFGFKSV